MTTRTESKADEIRAALVSARDIAKAAEEAGRDLTDEERKTVETHLGKASALKKELVTDTALDGLDGEIEAIEGLKRGSTIDAANTRAKTSGGRSLGRAFVENESVKGWLSELAPTGNVPAKARVQSPPVNFDGIKAFGYTEGTGRPKSGAKALVTGVSDTSAGALVDSDFIGLVDEDPYARPLNILDVITRGTTDGDTIEYVRVNTVTNNAAAVAEATSLADGEKPESGLTLTKITATVSTIAHWLPATKRALSDASQVRTLIDNFLRYGLFEELEDQIINGDGVGDNFTGLLSVSGVQSQAWDTDLLTTARKAKTKVRVTGRAMANAYALHPNDAERLDLLKDLEGRFYYGGPAQDGAQPLWRLPVVETEALPEGLGVVGDWRRLVLWDREQAAISVSDSHSDFFIRNLVAILAELRAAMGVFRPAAFCTFDTTASGTTA